MSDNTSYIYILKHVKKYREDYGYPEFPVCASEHYFLSREDAKVGVHTLLSAKSEWTYYETICFVIEQKIVGLENRKESDGVWLFDSMGNLQEQHFNQGDIVEVLDIDSKEKTVHLGIVAENNLIFSGIGYCSVDREKLIMTPRYEVPDDVREFLNYCMEHHNDNTDPTKYKCDIFDDQGHNTVDSTLICPHYDNELGRYVLRLGWENYREENRDTILPGSLSDTELDSLRNWLSEMKYGKTRLWYILREFRFYQNEENPPLSLDLTFNELVYGKFEH